MECFYLNWSGKEYPNEIHPQDEIRQPYLYFSGGEYVFSSPDLRFQTSANSSRYFKSPLMRSTWSVTWNIMNVSLTYVIFNSTLDGVVDAVWSSFSSVFKLLCERPSNVR